ncbi:hypothetical protein BGX28_010374 [Mortierella sp. GBA30]|nr:hypothetical protein BGX28_010374 [Mortierella sp. GBA30]
MAPFIRLALIAMLASAAFVTASPVIAPQDPNGPAPALAGPDTYDPQTPEPSNPGLTKRAAAFPKGAVSSCTKSRTVAITFDDGPFDFTNGLLNILKKKKVKATFFLNGNNYGNIADYASVIKRAYKEGHQIASHTWSHANLAEKTDKEILEEMSKLDDAVKKIIGVRPVYMRPPYGAVNDRVKNLLESNGYRIILWDLDTNDWQHTDDYRPSLKVYSDALGKGQHSKNALTLQHDPHRVTALEVAPRAIDLAKSRKFKVVTVGECLGDSRENWYRV